MDIYQERIKPLFLKSGLQDKEIEELLGLPRGVIYKWGTGKYKSYRSYIIEIASYFHVSTDYLLGKTDDPSPSGREKEPTGQTNGGISGLDNELVRLLCQLTPDEVEKVGVFVQGLLAARKA